MATTEATVDFVTKTTNVFHWADFLVFGAFIFFSLAIGVYYGLIKKQKQETTKDFLMGGKDMQVIPVALAIMSSFLSAILILGTPAEIYTQGTMYWMYLFGMCGAVILATVFFVPLLYRLKLTSSYEYLELRYKSSLAKLTGTLILFITQILYLGIAMYSPSTALEAVTGFPEWATIIVGGLVAMFYTAVGGMKASVWASAFQTLIMAAGVIAVIIKGCIDVGGVERMWELNQQGHRIEFFDFNPDPLERHTFWTLIIGGTVGWLSTYGVNQASVQRYCAMPTLNKGRAVVLLNIPGLMFFMTITALSGMAIYAYYASVGCDPLEAGYISNPNQLMPYFVLDRLDIPGIPGLFLAALFGGALSSVSASLSALSAVTWQDLMVPFEPFKSMSPAGQTIVTKVLVLVYGGIGIGMAFMSANLGGTVLQASLSFTGASGGPLLGLFVLGAFFPCANSLGAIIGGLIGLAVPLWISIGAYTMEVASSSLNTTTEFCFVNGTVNATAAPVIGEITGFDRLYLISYLWYPAIGMAIVVVLGLLITMVTDCLDPRDVPNKYLIPLFDRLCCCLPNKTLWILRCKKDFNIDDESEEAKVAPYAAKNDIESNGTHEKLSPEKSVPLQPIIHAYDNPAMTSDDPNQPVKRNVGGSTHSNYVPVDSRDYAASMKSKKARDSLPPPDEEPIYDEAHVDLSRDEPLPPPPEEVLNEDVEESTQF